jgi:hypothetical protein
LEDSQQQIRARVMGKGKQDTAQIDMSEKQEGRAVQPMPPEVIMPSASEGRLSPGVSAMSAVSSLTRSRTSGTFDSVRKLSTPQRAATSSLKDRVVAEQTKLVAGLRARVAEIEALSSPKGPTHRVLSRIRSKVELCTPTYRGGHVGVQRGDGSKGDVAAANEARWEETEAVARVEAAKALELSTARLLAREAELRSAEARLGNATRARDNARAVAKAKVVKALRDSTLPLTTDSHISNPVQRLRRTAPQGKHAREHSASEMSVSEQVAQGKLLSAEEMAQLRAECLHEQLSDGKLLSAEEMTQLRAECLYEQLSDGKLLSAEEMTQLEALGARSRSKDALHVHVPISMSMK